METTSWREISELIGIPVHGDAFSPEKPLSSRQSAADALLHALLFRIDPKLSRTAPPPTSQREQLKSYRIQLFKSVDIIIKSERESARGWDKDVTWRKSSFDDAKGEKFEAVLTFLGAICLRNLVEGPLKAPITGQSCRIFP